MANPSAPHVLLLEDQALVRAGMRALIELSEPRARVDEAASCAEALSLLATVEPDIAFIDIALKDGETGLAVLSHIRQRGLSTRAVMLSASGDPSIVMDCLRGGACGYIVKDMDGEGLFRRALDTVLRGGVFLPPDLPSDRRTGGAPADTLEAMGVRGRAAEALYYLCQGLSNQMIAHRMGVAQSTVANDYNTRLFRQFRVTNRAALIVEVARRGVVIPPPTPSAAVRTAAR